MGVVEEARLNLVLLYSQGDPTRALGLLRGLEPGTALEHICQVGSLPCIVSVTKGVPSRCCPEHSATGCEPLVPGGGRCAPQAVACALHGQASGSAEHIQRARESFLAVGSSPTEVDTVRGGGCCRPGISSWNQPCAEGIACSMRSRCSNLNNSLPSARTKPVAVPVDAARCCAGARPAVHGVCTAAEPAAPGGASLPRVGGRSL